MAWIRVVVAAVCCGVFSVAVVGCGGGGSGDEAAAEAEGVREVEYTVRGEVERLPGGMNDLLVRHEAIPEFDTGQRDEAGEPVLGMNTMSMEFPPPEGGYEDVSGLSVGDKLSLTLVVRHDAETDELEGWYLKSWEMLPAETELDFSPLEDAEGVGEG